MELILSKKAIKSIKKLSPREQTRVREKLNDLLNSIAESGLIPSGELNIKALEGSWTGFLRMRVGKIRVLFTIDSKKEELRVYNIGYRGDIYKSQRIMQGYVLSIDVGQKL